MLWSTVAVNVEDGTCLLTACAHLVTLHHWGDEAQTAPGTGAAACGVVHHVFGARSCWPDYCHLDAHAPL
jgi:hypothetical protein